MSVTVLKPKTPAATGKEVPATPDTSGRHPLLTLRDEIDRLFDDVFSGSLMRPFGRFGTEWPRLSRSEDPFRAIWPKADLTETDDAFTMTAELPGMEEGDIEVSLSENTLTVRGEKAREVKEDEENYHLMERSYGAVHRSFRVPNAVDRGKIDARFDNGVLTVTMPKAKARAKATKTIPVKGAKKARKTAKAKKAA